MVFPLAHRDLQNTWAGGQTRQLLLDWIAIFS